ncbi:Carbohydrate family 9 binding domain-like [Catalinimonas alkaloidigena]|uniref:Carbohydrate family 9 binding domain-like n=2 Tax=Catalinimonas alkaloidigena TaxID=1075417 RepID=A0A1G9VF98_9BACT|nr:Carbohydrate family 9 binding domain-like [Catalinimonas alkaloidigena]
MAVVAQQPAENFPPPAIPETIRAVRTEENIKVDGELTEAAWQQAPVIERFFRIEPRQGGDYRYATAVRVLFNEKNLYVGVFCADSLGKKGVRAQDLRRDFNWGENDIFGIQLDPQHLKQYCVSFQTTPYGNQRDLQNFNDNNTDNDWNALWMVRTHPTDSGYFAEFAIPFKSLRYERPTQTDSVTWGITFTRLARRDYEQTVFPAIPQSFSPYRMTYAAELTGLTVPEPSANVRIEPYLLYQFEDAEAGGERSTDSNVKLGGDIKWAINPRSVVDLTFNTDFAQADVDLAVNNLERFNIFFPERRQFFLENSGIWAGAGNQSVKPFFSRTIGLQGIFNAAPARIDGGARYTMRNDDRAVAGLYMHQAETSRTPAASFAVARYLQNYGKENNVGVMATHRLDEASSELGTQRSHNTTLTIDGLIRPRNELTVTYMLSGSRDNDNDTMGLAGSLYAGYQSNQWYLGWQTNFVSRHYHPDMGFVFQQNVIWHSPGGYYIWRPKRLPWIRRWDPGAFMNYYHDADRPGHFQQGNIYLFPVYIYFVDNSFLEYAIYPTWQRINFDFAPLGISIAQGDYYYTRHQINYNTDQSRKLSLSGNVSWGKFYNGKRLTLNGGTRLAPIPHIAFTANYEYNSLEGLGEAQEKLETHLVTLGSRLALNPRVQLSVLYQYNSFDGQGRWNVRGSWEYRPLSFVYLVFNDTRNNQLDTPFETQQLIGKMTFLKQF